MNMDTREDGLHGVPRLVKTLAGMLCNCRTCELQPPRFPHQEMSAATCALPPSNSEVARTMPSNVRTCSALLQDGRQWPGQRMCTHLKTSTKLMAVLRMLTRNTTCMCHVSFSTDKSDSALCSDLAMMTLAMSWFQDR